jgi:carbamoyltransferase
MYILGLSSYAHESSCSLIKNGEIKSIIEEERLNREKHTWKLPILSIKKCLEMEKISINDIDHFTFFWQPKKEISGNLNHFIRYFPSTLNTLTASSGGGEMNSIERIKAMKKIGKAIKEEFNLSSVPHIKFTEHHLAHVASSFFVSPFEKSAILILDGRGESISTSMYHGEKNSITKISETKVPHSLGHFYAAMTDYLGFKPFFDEWKVMGMSAYGKDDYVEKFQDLIQLLPNGQFRLNLKYFNFHTHGSSKWVSDYFIKEFGEKRNPNSEYEQKHFDMAFGLQKIIEKTGVHLANFLYDNTKLSNLCLAGGVALNVLMNSEIIRKTPFKNIFIQPIAHDAGTSFGSALYFYNHELKNDRSFQFKHAYWGPEYTNEEIEDILVKSKLVYHKSNNIANETAQQIANEKIIGWFQGRMEAGPRALGNRSITVSPLKADMKDRLNKRVKKREYFRPFAPSVLEERVSDFFEMPKNTNSPYMIISGEVRKEKREIIPAVTHADNTARVHTVNSRDNPKYWNLIHEFEKITGVPILLNTSFNENEPIVCTPQHAVECFLRTDFDILSIGDFLVSKS